MYRRKIYKLNSDVMEVEDYHTRPYTAGGKRVRKQETSPEHIEKTNQRNREKKCRRRLREYFRENDYFVTLTYEEGKRPGDMKEAKKDFHTLAKKLYWRYKKAGCDLRWIRNIEVGSRGAWHIHLIVNRITDADLMITESWEKGKVIIKPMYQQGNFRELAAYMVKTPRTDKRLKDANHSTSRNIPVPEPEIRTYNFRNHWNKPYIPKGWEIDKDSIYEGINLEGYPIREYTLIRRKDDRNRKRIHGGRIKEPDHVS